MVKEIMQMRWDFISEMIIKNGYKKIVEVGVKAGENVKGINYRLQEANYKLDKFYLIDDTVPRCRFTTDKLPLVTIKKTSLEAVKDFGFDLLDLVFIDADHSYKSTKEDILAWVPIIRKGGLICGHDYNEGSKNGVEQAVKEIFTNFNLVQEMHTKIWWKYVN